MESQTVSATPEETTQNTHINKRNSNTFGFVCGTVANCLIAASTIRFFLLPYGSGLDWEHWFTQFVLPISFVAFFVGISLSLWEIDRRREQGQSTTLNQVGFFLNLLPLGLAFFLFGWRSPREICGTTAK